MILDSLSEQILRFITETDNTCHSVNIETICDKFSHITSDVVSQAVGNLYQNQFIDGFESDNGLDCIELLYKGRVYFENKAAELSKQQPQAITINNSSNFNVGNDNTINVTNGITADEACHLIEQSSLSDKEALKEIITLLNDSIANNKPIEPSKFKTAMSCVTSVSALIQAIGGVIVSLIKR